MTTVAQLVEYLQTLPQDAEVDVLKEVSANWSTWTEFTALEIPGEYGYSDNLEVYDFRDNQFVKEDDARFGKVYVSFGGK
jgi:Ran GTPase-activating protein (RanGAP) involved in mRNA processing and transport